MKTMCFSTVTAASDRTTTTTRMPNPASTATHRDESEFVVPFGGSAPRAKVLDKEILGGKGLGLQEMSSIGIEVPPGFTLTTPLCQVYDQHGDLPDDLWRQVELAIQRVERDMGRQFGDAEHPLLFSCRSGAALSMPGMMDTVLNVVRIHI
jgi:pyruvate, orthophosphate dikinase